MSVQLIAQIFLFLSGISCIITAGFVTFAIIGEVNRRLPEADQISYLWGTPAKSRRIKSEYRRLYPNGRLLLYLNILTFSGFGFFLAIALAWRFGVFK